MIFQFKIALLDVGVPVWRRVQVNSHSTFQELHEVIQVSFDWYDSHLHNFSIRKSNGKRFNMFLLNRIMNSKDLIQMMVGESFLSPLKS